MTLTSSNLKFNKATAQELGFPAYVRMLIDAPTRRVAIEPCSENAKSAVPFSKDEKKQNYAVVLKIPALLTAARKLADIDETKDSLSFEGTFYPEDRVIIFDLSQGREPKRRRRKVVESETVESVESIEPEVIEEEIVEPEEKKHKRPGRPAKNAAKSNTKTANKPAAKRGRPRKS